MPGSHGCGPTKRRRLHRRTAHSRSKEVATMAKANSAAPFRVIEETPAYWRVVFDYPPFNILDATIFGGLQDLLLRMDASQRLRVVVFEKQILEARSEEHTSELQSHLNLVCRLLLEKKKTSSRC